MRAERTNMQNDPILSFFETFSPVTNAGAILMFLLKGLFVTAFFLYIIFAFVVIRQVRLMSQTITTPLEPVLRLAAYAHFFLVLAVFVLAVIIL